MPYEYVLRNRNSIKYDQICRFQENCRFKDKCWYHHVEIKLLGRNAPNAEEKNGQELRPPHPNRDQNEDEAYALKMTSLVVKCFRQQFGDVENALDDIKKRLAAVEVVPSVAKGIAVQQMRNYSSVPTKASPTATRPELNTVKVLVRGLRDDRMETQDVCNARLHEILHAKDDEQETASETKRKKKNKITRTATQIKTVKKKKRPKAQRTRKKRQSCSSQEIKEREHKATYGSPKAEHKKAMLLAHAAKMRAAADQADEEMKQETRKETSRPVQCDFCHDRGHAEYECPNKHCDMCGNEGHGQYSCPMVYDKNSDHSDRDGYWS